MILPFLRENGWETDVLAVDPEMVASPRDPWLEQILPKDVAVHRCPALSLRWSKLPGLGGIDVRSRRSIRLQGNELLRRQRYDLIYFSTTVFGVLPVACAWKRAFNVPYVIDYQDPWVSDYYREHPAVVPPGGRFKYRIVDSMARRNEPNVLRSCNGITSVSPDYPKMLDHRYPWFVSTPRLVAPFPGAKRDFDLLRSSKVAPQSLFDPKDGKIHWVYVGRGGADMRTAVEGLFQALARWKTESPDKASQVRLHFIGTSYAPMGTGIPSIQPLADSFGIAEMVDERTDRVGYGTMLHCLNDAHALLAIGSDDPAYTASKLYPYLLARKPLLAIFHRASSVNEVIAQVGGAKLVSFDPTIGTDELSRQVADRWLSNEAYRERVPLNEEAFAPYTDVGQAKQLCDYFATIANQGRSHVDG